MKGMKTKQSAVRKLHLLISIFIVLLRVNWMSRSGFLYI